MPPTDVVICHFCEDERPRFALAVIERKVPSRGLLMLAESTQKRRFCTDKAGCMEAAARWKAEEQNEA